MKQFDYHRPSTIDEAIALLARYGDQARILAGGTALLIDMERGECTPTHLIGLEQVDGLSAIREADGLHIGTSVTLTDVADYVGERPAFRALVDSIWLFGGKQIQNTATVGGNICKASPGADLVPPLLCLDAELHLCAADGKRVIPLDGFLTGTDQTAIRPAEILCEVVLPPLPPRTGTAFQKMMRRQAEDLSIVAVAARITLAEDGETCVAARIALCAVAPAPFRAYDAEALLTGFPLAAEQVKRAAQVARDASRPISDVRASADYRRMLVETLVERAIVQAAQRASSERITA